MPSKVPELGVTALIGVIGLLSGGFMAVTITFIMFRHSLHSFALWFIVAMLSALALYGFLVLRMAILALRSDGKEKKEANKGPERRGIQPNRPGRRSRRNPDPKPGLAGDPA